MCLRRDIFWLISLLAAWSVFGLMGLPAASAQRRFLNPYPSQLADGSDMPAPQRTRSKFSTNLLDGSGNVMPIVRLGYVIPSNRVPQVNGVASIRAMATTAQKWFADQMRLHGYAGKTFRLEMEADGVTPRVQVVSIPETDAYVREDVWGHTLTPAGTAGLTIWAPGEIWVLVSECHIQNADSSISGGAALGASYGSGSDPGVAVVGSDLLARLLPAYATDDRAYAGNFISEIGPYVLKQNITFLNWDGTTFSSLNSAAQGAFIHEIMHALGLPHDFRDDLNGHGNLMGNGFRGLRGCLYPGRYPADFTILARAAGRILNFNRYFNDGQPESVRPNLTISTSGTVATQSGKLPVNFTADDASGLSSAVLTLNGDFVADQSLSGTSASGSFSVPYFTPGVVNNYQISVFDLYGNKQTVSAPLTPALGGARAPVPIIKITTPAGVPGDSVLLDASASSDPIYSASSLTVRWDLDGDAILDTTSTSTKTRTVILANAGTRFITAQISNPAAVQSFSTPLYVHTERPAQEVDLNADTGILRSSWLSHFGFDYQIERSTDLLNWNSLGLPLVHGDGTVLQDAFSALGSPARLTRLKITRRSTP